MGNAGIGGALDRLGYGVYVIGVAAGERRNGMTAAWVTQVSVDPPMIVVAVGRTHYTAELIEVAQSFSISVLTPDQYELARRCGFASGRAADKLDGTRVMRGTTGAPIIADCAAYLECTLAMQIVVGDHVLFVGEVIGGADNHKPAMVYRSRDFFE